MTYRGITLRELLKRIIKELNMAQYDNKAGTKTAKKQYATDPEGMMQDAKEYASKDFNSVLSTFKELGKENAGLMEVITEEQIANALIQVKYEQIVKSRTERVTYFD